MTNESIATIVNNNLYGEVNADTVGTIGRFLILWGVYERHFHCTTIRKPDGTVKYDVKFDYKKANTDKSIIISDINTPFTYLKERYWLDNTYGRNRYDTLEINNSYNNDIYDVLKGTSTKYDEKFAIQVIMYQLRNNLFHGKKGIGSLNDNKKNFEIMNAVLVDIMSKV